MLIKTAVGVFNNEGIKKVRADFYKKCFKLTRSLVSLNVPHEEQRGKEWWGKEERSGEIRRNGMRIGV